ncbi:site-2 protease family protein [Isosphaeraceae bacterium EP7]
METLNFLLNVAKVVLGLGFVIFLHELGHFALAKWNGVKVKAFSIGFPPALWKRRWGETEYVIGAVPLGGYVSMLGEGDENDPENPDAANDPRAYKNKSVGARMAIITAGVVMNLILGIAFFMFVYMNGTLELPAKVGRVVAGSPAYKAGLRSGDDIVSIDGRDGVDFGTLKMKVALSATGQTLRLGIKRPGQDGLITMDFEPRREKSAETPTIGIVPSKSLDLARPPFIRPPGTDAKDELKEAETLKLDDRLIAVGPAGGPLTELVPEDSLGFDRIASANRGVPLTAAFRRPVAKDKPSETPERLELTFPVNHFLDFGLRMEMGPISAIRGNSPAERAGFQVGDLIETIDGKPVDDPMRLPDLGLSHAGTPLEFVVKRGAESKTIRATPDATPTWVEAVFPGESLEIPGLGLAFPVGAKVRAVTVGSPAEAAGIKAGDTLTSMVLTPTPTPALEGKEGAKARPAEVPKPFTIKFEADQVGPWAYAFNMVQNLPTTQITLGIKGRENPVEIMPVAVADWFYPDRGLGFQTLTRQLPPQPLGASFRRALYEGYDNVVNIYAMIRGLFQSRVSMSSMAGVPRISGMAYAAADSSFVDLIKFLGMLSINLAVINFLPIFPLDGGQFLFLVAEKIRGRPLPDSAMVVGQWAGVAFVLGLILFTNLQDVFLLTRQYFS